MPATVRRPLSTLVLNADYRPISTWPLSRITAEDAISTLWRDRADVVETWPDEFFHSPSITIPVPKVIALRHYAPINARPKFCRRSVYLRDRFRCQYCGKRFPTEELTFDHVVPRAAGGITVWENILTCCVPCNTRKRASMPDYSGRKGRRSTTTWRPLRAPRQPTTAELLRAGLEFLEPEIKSTWGEWLYWNTSLQP
jgi:5-methylcytosine-specific restriction endonuclease McrA